MKIEEICVNLELSKQLKEAGTKQESLFYWYPYMQDVAGHDVVRYELFYGERERAAMLNQPFYKDVIRYSAFTSAELLEMLPSDIKDAHLDIYKDDREGFTKWEVSYSPVSERSIGCVSDNNFANALAILYLYLKQHSLLPDSKEKGGI